MKETIVRLARKKAVLWGFWWAGALGLGPAFSTITTGLIGLGAVLVSLVCGLSYVPEKDNSKIGGIIGMPKFPVSTSLKFPVMSLWLSLVAVLMALVGGVMGFSAARADHVRQAREQTKVHQAQVQIRDAIDSIDSIPAGEGIAEFSVHNTDSVWIVSPIGKDSTVFVGEYVNRGEVVQNMLADIVHATDLFCNRTSKGYTEYKSCKELVTTKITTTKSLSHLGAPQWRTINLDARPWRGALYSSIAYAGDQVLLPEMQAGSSGFTVPLSLKSDTMWSTDSASAYGLTYKASLHIEYDNRTRRWTIKVWNGERWVTPSSSRGEALTADTSPDNAYPPVVKSGSDTGDGSRSSESILHVIRAHIGGFRYTYEKYLKQNPNTGGKISLKFTISAAGDVTAISVTGSGTGNSELDDEIKRKARRMKFDPIEKGNVTVTYDFVLNSWLPMWLPRWRLHFNRRMA